MVLCTISSFLLTFLNNNIKYGNSFIWFTVHHHISWKRKWNSIFQIQKHLNFQFLFENIYSLCYPNVKQKKKIIFQIQKCTHTTHCMLIFLLRFFVWILIWFNKENLKWVSNPMFELLKACEVTKKRKKKVIKSVSTRILKGFPRVIFICC